MRKSSTPRKHRRSRTSPITIYLDHLTGMNIGPYGYAIAGCPFHEDHEKSLAINYTDGSYRCMTSCCGSNGKDTIAFISELLGLKRSDAAEYLEVRYD